MQKGVNDIIVQAENVVEQQPDRALRLLNTVLFPEKLNKSRYNKYYLILLEAKDKSYKDITSDTLIFAVKDYYIQKKDYPNAALAAFYCGRVRHEQKKIEKAIEAYIEAENFADKNNNYNLKGLIQANLGILNREHSSYKNAIELLKNAVVLYDKAKNYRNEIGALRIMGDCFALNNKIDSALYYYDISLKLANLYDIPKLQSDIKVSMGVVFREQGSYDDAIQNFQDAFAIPNNEVEQARILLNIAQVYELKNNTDSSTFYLDKALSLNISNPWIIRSSYLLKSQSAEKNKRYQDALDNFKEYYNYTTKVFDSEKNNKLLEIQEKYDYEKLKNKHNQLIIKHQKAFIILSLVLIVACIIIIIYYRKSVQDKKLLLETEQKLITFQKIAQNLSEEEQSFRNTLFQQINIIRKTALIETEITDDERKSGQKLLKKFNKIVYGQDTLDWDQLYQAMNSLENNFYDKIKEKYKQWSDTEFRIFCLTHNNQFSDAEIAIILNKSINMIRKMRGRIKKDIGTPKYSHNYFVLF